MKIYEAEISDDSISKKILDGDLEYIRDYFEKNPDEINKKLPYDQDLVMFSIYANKKEIFDWLLKNGAKARADKKGFTPLHQAAIHYDPYFAKELVKFGLKINRRNKKTPTPLAYAAEYVTGLVSGLGSPTSLSEKIEAAEELKDTFKELILLGADIHTTDRDGDDLFIQLVKYGITPFVKIMMEADKTLLKQTLANYSVLEIAMSNHRDDMVEMLLDAEDFEIEFEDARRFITSTHNTDAAMRLYNLLSDDLKGLLAIENMLYVQNGEEKMLRLFERGVKITPAFIKNERVKEIADKLLKTHRKYELSELAVEHDVSEFLSEDVKNTFVF